MTMQARSTRGSDGDKVDAIAKILGVDGSDYEAMRSAFDAVVFPVTIHRQAAVRQLSQRELTMCKEMGVDITAYAADKTRRASAVRGSR